MQNMHFLIYALRFYSPCAVYKVAICDDCFHVCERVKHIRLGSGYTVCLYSQDLIFSNARFCRACKVIVSLIRIIHAHTTERKVMLRAQLRWPRSRLLRASRHCPFSVALAQTPMLCIFSSELLRPSLDQLYLIFHSLFFSIIPLLLILNHHHHDHLVMKNNKKHDKMLIVQITRFFFLNCLL